MIRPATAEDAQAISDLWNWMIRETLATFTSQEKRVGDIRDMIETRPGAFLVAGDGDDLAGFLTFGAFRAGPGYAATAEHSLIVKPASQRQGTGRQLMTAGEAAASALGIHVMVAGISSANPAAIGFHAALDFEQVGYLPEVGRKAGRWLDLVLMQKILQTRP